MSRRWVRVPAAVLFVVPLLAVGPVESKDPVEAIQAQVEIPEESLLDVGIQIFDTGLPEDDEYALEDEGIYPDVRKSEARFLPFHLKNTLESTGHWGAVRVVPRGADAVDVTVSGAILVSNGRELVAQVRVVDSRGRVWRKKRYKQQANPFAYRAEAAEVGDPYQSLYNRIANDMLSARRRLDEDEVRELRETARLLFAADIAPEAFDDYLSVDKKGRREIERLPADDDTMMQRIAVIRERDYMFVDALNEYYAGFYRSMGEPYTDWRRYSYEEQMALRAIRREARMKKILGGLLILGGAMAEGSSTAARVARDAAVIGGAVAIQQGIEQGKEAKIHVEALRELAASFDSEIAPVLVEVEGHTLRLEGSAETQYAEWRRLLGEIFASETGLAQDPDADRQVGIAGAAAN